MSPEVSSNVLMKESENVYNLWCSGRVCCEGMLVTLKLLKRQDLVSTIARFFSPRYDQVVCIIIAIPNRIFVEYVRDCGRDDVNIK